MRFTRTRRVFAVQPDARAIKRYANEPMVIGFEPDDHLLGRLEEEGHEYKHFLEGLFDFSPDITNEELMKELDTFINVDLPKYREEWRTARYVTEEEMRAEGPNHCQDCCSCH